jgi:hypothetical protein
VVYAALLVMCSLKMLSLPKRREATLAVLRPLVLCLLLTVRPSPPLLPTVERRAFCLRRSTPR